MKIEKITFFEGYYRLFLKMLAFSEIYVLNWIYINSVKTTLYYGTKKSIGCPFASFSWKKTALMPFLSENAHSLKITLLSCPYFVKKSSILSKTNYFMWCFSNLLLKTPSAMPIFGQENVHSVKITLFHGLKKSIECLFFKKMP